jgi:SAM-dependent methyltransferase
MVEQFSKRLVVGWVSVPKRAAPVRVTLHLGKLQVASTYATPGAFMAGVLSAQREGEAETADGRQKVVRHGAPPTNSWELPNIPSPPGDRRNSPREIRTFSFRVREIWPYLRKQTRVTVRVDGRPLPIYGHGMFLTPPRNGQHTVADLRRKLDDGYLLSQYGKVQLSKKLDVEWQQQVMGLYREVRELLAERYGYDMFFVYGTLLGAVREGGYIGHDVDFDAAYVSRHTDGPAAAAELEAIGLALIEAGYAVDAMRSCLHIGRRDDSGARIDLFHTYFDGDDLLRLPFGVAGQGTYTRTQWKGTTEIDFPGGRGLVPVDPEPLVAHLYGDDWRQPKPGFNWNLDRTDNAEEGTLSIAQRSTVYWANFYAGMEYTEGSSFFRFVNARPETPQVVLDIGCGDGRDSCAFGAVGRTVTGLDRSAVGVEHARAHAAQTNLDDKVSFEVCDVSDAERLGSIIAARLAEHEEPALFYLRFFLHSISEDVQETLMGVIRDQARPGDHFAAEFRTDKDEDRSKVHGRHYRRFQNGAAFGQRLTTDYGFTLLHEEEGTGLSPYRGEDPVLYRVIARR